MWPPHHNIWFWRLWRLSLIRVFVLHPFTKFEVHRPCSSADMTTHSALRVSRPGDLVLDLSPFDLIARRCATQLSYQFWCFCNFSFLTTRTVRRTTSCLATLIAMAPVFDTGVRAPSVYRVWISYAFPFGRYDTISVLALIGLVTLTFELLTLKLAT